VHAANYERSEGAKQCVVFHPQVPPNNIQRNFFFFFLFLFFGVSFLLLPRLLGLEKTRPLFSLDRKM
jgi:hypothetical protein